MIRRLFEDYLQVPTQFSVIAQVSILLIMLMVVVIILLIVNIAKKSGQQRRPPHGGSGRNPRRPDEAMRHRDQLSALDTHIVLQGVSGYFAGQRMEFFNRITIGRDHTAAELIYPEGTKGVSRLHCRIEKSYGRIQIQDLQSSYGTFVNDRKIIPGEKVQITPGDRISIGGPQNSFQIIE